MTFNFKEIDAGIRAGYRDEERGVSGGSVWTYVGSVRAVRAWLEAWRSLLPVIDSRGIDRIEHLQRAYPWSEDIDNWIQEVVVALLNAGNDDPTLYDEGVNYCQEVLDRFPGEDQLLIENLRRTQAEYHARAGRVDKADELLRGWLERDPAWGYGWIGWFDLYDHIVSPPDPARAEQLLLQGLAVRGVRDESDVLDRLARHYSDGGREEEATAMRRRIEMVARRPPALDEEVSVTVHGSTLKVTSPLDFGERGLPVEEIDRLSPVRPAPRASVASRAKVGRNEPCPCGSGRKFKRCCGA